MTEANKGAGRGDPVSGDASTSATATAMPAPAFTQDSRSIAIQTPLGEDVLLCCGRSG